MNSRQEEGLLACTRSDQQGEYFRKGTPLPGRGSERGWEGRVRPREWPPRLPGAGSDKGLQQGGRFCRRFAGPGPQPHVGVAHPFLHAQGPALQRWREDPAVTFPCPWGQHTQCGLLSSGAPLCWPLLWLFDGPLACASRSWAKSNPLCAHQPSTRQVYPRVWSELSGSCVRFPFCFLHGLRLRQIFI